MLSSLFFLLFFSLFASNWVISKSPSSGSLILSSTWSTPMQIPLIFYLIHWIFSSRMFVSFFFIVFISLLNFSFCSCIFFLILLTCLLCFLRAHCFIRTAILNSLSSRLQDFAFLSSVIWRIITFLRWLFFLIFYVPWIFALLICLWWSRHLLKSLIVAFKWGTVCWTCYFWGSLWPCMYIPALHILLHFMADFLSFYVFSGSYNSPAWLLKTSLSFSRRWRFSSSFWFSVAQYSGFICWREMG